MQLVSEQVGPLIEPPMLSHAEQSVVSVNSSVGSDPHSLQRQRGFSFRIGWTRAAMIFISFQIILSDKGSDWSSQNGAHVGICVCECVCVCVCVCVSEEPDWQDTVDLLTAEVYSWISEQWSETPGQSGPNSISHNCSVQIDMSGCCACVCVCVCLKTPNVSIEMLFIYDCIWVFLFHDSLYLISSSYQRKLYVLLRLHPFFFGPTCIWGR